MVCLLEVSDHLQSDFIAIAFKPINQSAGVCQVGSRSAAALKTVALVHGLMDRD